MNQEFHNIIIDEPVQVKDKANEMKMNGTKSGTQIITVALGEPGPNRGDDILREMSSKNK